MFFKWCIDRLTCYAAIHAFIYTQTAYVYMHVNMYIFIIILVKHIFIYIYSAFFLRNLNSAEQHTNINKTFNHDWD